MTSGSKPLSYRTSGRAVPAWASTPEIIAQMFNKAFDTSLFKGKVATYGEIIPSWTTKDFDPFFAWIPNVEIPDARADLAAVFNSTSTQNYWGINEPELIDAKLDKALTLVDYEEAYALVREVQDLAIENGQWGRCIGYNYVATRSPLELPPRHRCRRRPRFRGLELHRI